MVFSDDLPGRDIGGETGTIIGIHKFGGASYIFPLGRSCATYETESNSGENKHAINKKPYKRHPI